MNNDTSELGECYKNSNELLNKVKEYTYDIKKYNHYKQYEKDQLHSSLYQIEDSIWGIEYYINSEFPDNENFKGRYILTHGLMQSMILIQDGLKNIYNLLLNNIKNKTYQTKKERIKLKYIRDIRNDITGHPSNRLWYDENKDNGPDKKKGGNIERYYINSYQHSMNKRFLNYSICDKLQLEPDKFIKIDIYYMLSLQGNFLNKKLTELLNNLEKEEIEFKNKYKGIKISDLFIEINNLKNSSKNINNESKRDCINNSLDKIKKELEERYGPIKDNHEIEYIINYIDEIFDLLNNINNKYNIENINFAETYLSEILYIYLKELEEYCINKDIYSGAIDNTDPSILINNVIKNNKKKEIKLELDNIIDKSIVDKDSYFNKFREFKLSNNYDEYKSHKPMVINPSKAKKILCNDINLLIMGLDFTRDISQNILSDFNMRFINNDISIINIINDVISIYTLLRLDNIENMNHIRNRYLIDLMFRKLDEIKLYVETIDDYFENEGNITLLNEKPTDCEIRIIDLDGEEIILGK